jgi:hypothetical protein
VSWVNEPVSISNPGWLLNSTGTYNNLRAIVDGSMVGVDSTGDTSATTARVSLSQSWLGTVTEGSHTAGLSYSRNRLPPVKS